MNNTQSRAHIHGMQDDAGLRKPAPDDFQVASDPCSVS